jgi:hypothetical protein
MLQIPGSINSEFMLDMLEIFSIDLDPLNTNKLSDEEKKWMIHALFFFGSTNVLDSKRSQGFLVLNITEH